MSGDQNQPNCSSFDRNISQASDGSGNLSQPLPEDTFSVLWSHIAGFTDSGTTNSVCANPVDWNFSDFQGGDLVENNVDVQLQHIELDPLGVVPDSNNLMQTQSFQPNMLPDNAAPGPPMSEYSTDTTTTPPPTSAASQALPSNVDYSGDYGFEIYLGQPTSTAAKSVSWTYSPTLKKLFVDKDKACPIMFKTSLEPPPGSYIRAMPIFKKPEYVQEAVRRCPNHQGPHSENSAYHLITCSDLSALYEEDSTTGRMSVSMAYNMPQVGTEHTTYLLTFKCFLSCVGGLNRRQIQTVFTLENNSGQVLGRQVIDVRVCACPGRDRKGEEKHQTEKPNKKPLKRGQSKITQSFSVTQIGGKRKKPDEEVYCIMVKGRTNYDLLMRIKESLELMTYATQDQRTQYKADQTRLQQQFRKVIKTLQRVKPGSETGTETK